MVYSASASVFSHVVGNASVAAVPSFPLARAPALQLCRLRPMLFLKQTLLLRILQENFFKTAASFKAFTSLDRKRMVDLVNYLFSSLQEDSGACLLIHAKQTTRS